MAPTFLSLRWANARQREMFRVLVFRHFVCSLQLLCLIDPHEIEHRDLNLLLGCLIWPLAANPY